MTTSNEQPGIQSTLITGLSHSMMAISMMIDPSPSTQPLSPPAPQEEVGADDSEDTTETDHRDRQTADRQTVRAQNT